MNKTTVNRPAAWPRPARDELYNRLNREIGRAVVDRSMIEEGDHIMIAVSGGKDSLAMVYFLHEFQQKAPVSFQLTCVNLDQGQPGFDTTVLPALFEKLGVAYEIVTRDTYSQVIATEGVKTYCSLCSRLRRGILTGTAARLGCNKIALGHHRDDLLETFMLNQFYSGKLGTMKPHYTIADTTIDIIRPLYACREDDIAAFFKRLDWPIIPCNLCGSQNNLRRQKMKNLLAELEKTDPDIKNSLFAAMHNPHPGELL